MKKLLLALLFTAPLLASPASAPAFDAELDTDVAQIHAPALQAADAPEVTSDERLKEAFSLYHKRESLRELAKSADIDKAISDYPGETNHALISQKIQQLQARMRELLEKESRAAEQVGVLTTFAGLKKGYESELLNNAWLEIVNTLQKRHMRCKPTESWTSKPSCDCATLVHAYLGNESDTQLDAQYWQTQFNALIAPLAQTSVSMRQEIHRMASFYLAANRRLNDTFLPDIEGWKLFPQFTPYTAAILKICRQELIDLLTQRVPVKDLVHLIADYEGQTGQYTAGELTSLVTEDNWRRLPLRNLASLKGFDTCQYSSGMVVLDIAHNSLTSVNAEHLRPLKELEQLSVASNKLKTFPLAAIDTYCPKLTRLVATDNLFSDDVKKHLAQVWAKAGKNPDNLKL